MLGVVQHRAATGSDPAETAQQGYVSEEAVIDYAEAAGLVFEASSEVNANPRDTKDYPDGVWTLPPSYRLGDEDRERYSAIGESDRMTLRFRKPE
jgi:predicted methyltransferase